MLLGAGGDQEVRDRETMPASLAELPVRAYGDLHCFDIDPQVAKVIESLLDVGVVARTTSAIEHLQSCDSAQADLSELECLWCGALQCRLVGEQQPL